MSGSKPSRVTKALAGVGLAAALLSACSRSEPVTQPPTSSATSPGTTAAPTPTPTPTPTPSEPTPPALPALAKEDSKAGAKAFATHYIELMNYGSATGNTQELQKASSNCAGCNEYIDLYERTYAAGGFFKDAGIQPVTSFTREEGDAYIVLMTVQLPRTQYKLRQQDPVRVGRSQEVSLRLSVSRAGDGNVATELTGLTA